MQRATWCYTLVGVVLLLILGYTAVLGANKAEKAECIKWSQLSQEYEQFYLTPAQTKQCQAQFNTNKKGQELLDSILVAQ